MDNLNTDLEVDISDNEPKDIVVDVKSAEPENKADSSTPEPNIDDLKKIIDDERNKRIKAESLANEHSLRAKQAQGEAINSNYSVLLSSIDATSKESDECTSRYEQALELGDYKSAAKVQRDMVRIEAKLKNLEDHKYNFDNQKKAPEKQTDAFEEIVKTLQPKTAQWVRNNPSVIVNGTLSPKALTAHNDAIDFEGLEPESDAYFRHIEKKLNLNTQTKDPPQSNNFQAPASRSSPSLSTGNTSLTKIRITPKEREIASIMGISDRDYAISKAELIKTGQMSSN